MGIDDDTDTTSTEDDLDRARRTVAVQRPVHWSLVGRLLAELDRLRALLAIADRRRARRRETRGAPPPPAP